MKLTRRRFLWGLGAAAIGAVVPKDVIRKSIEPDEATIAYTHGYSIINGVRISDELLDDAICTVRPDISYQMPWPNTGWLRRAVKATKRKHELS